MANTLWCMNEYAPYSFNTYYASTYTYVFEGKQNIYVHFFPETMDKNNQSRNSRAYTVANKHNAEWKL